jgi:hypothetical protein
MRPNTKSRCLLAAVLWLLAVLCVSQFALPLQAAPNTTFLAPTGYLMKIEYQGGLCVYGGCYSYTLIYRNGTVLRSDRPDVVTRGQLDAESLQTLIDVIDTADYAALRAVKFTDICPTAYDGSETVYTFYHKGDAEVISDCEYVIDYSQPLFSTINTLLPKIGTTVPPIVTATPLPTFTFTPTPSEMPPLERVLLQLSTDWYCFRPEFGQQQDGAVTFYWLRCPVAAADDLNISLVQYETEEQAQRAFNPIPVATATTFHSFPAAAGIAMKTEMQTTEYLIIRARRTLITIRSTYEFTYGRHANDAAESIFKVAVNLSLSDFYPLATPTPQP